MYINCRMNCTSTGGGEGEKLGKLGFFLQIIFPFHLCVLWAVCVFVLIMCIATCIMVFQFYSVSSSCPVCCNPSFCVEMLNTDNLHPSMSEFTLCFTTQECEFVCAFYVVRL